MSDKLYHAMLKAQAYKSLRYYLRTGRKFSEEKHNLERALIEKARNHKELAEMIIGKLNQNESILGFEDD